MQFWLLSLYYTRFTRKFVFKKKDRKYSSIAIILNNNSLKMNSLIRIIERDMIVNSKN